MPEMIPMPGEPGKDPRGIPPESFTKQLSQQEEQAAILNFMGNMYGETKKMDGQIVNQSTTLSNKSQEIKQHIEQVVSNAQQSVPQAPAVQPVEVSQPTPVPQVQPVIVEQPKIQDNQMLFSFETNEKDELFLLIEKAISKIDKLQIKVDKLLEYNKNTKVTSLPVKRQSKKKTVESKEEV